jgi:DMSO/TMAO reductase YedYZ heme-binding membrane subunit
MIHMLYVLMIHIVMDIFEIAISMIKYILYVIIMLIYGIKMIWKMSIFLRVRRSEWPTGGAYRGARRCRRRERTAIRGAPT